MTDSTSTGRRSSRTPTAVDSYIGQSIQRRRADLNMTQVGLATLIGLTFQQVQKFEAGLNRVPASRLADIAAALNSYPGEFFPPVHDARAHQCPNDNTRIKNAIAKQISSQEALVEDLHNLYRSLSNLGMQMPTGGGRPNSEIEGS